MRIVTLANIPRALIVKPDYELLSLLGDFEPIIYLNNRAASTLNVVEENFVEYLGAEAFSDGKKTWVIEQLFVLDEFLDLLHNQAELFGVDFHHLRA